MPAITKNLETYAVSVREYVDRDADLGVGLWIPAQAAGQLAVSGTADFKQFLAQRRLCPFTINGFPYDNFHQDVVKQSVYLPAWWDTERLEYTKQLAAILGQLLPESAPVGSISTLPIGWPNNPLSEHGRGGADDSPEMLETAGRNLRDLADYLQRLEENSGRRIVIAIEPEPGCILDTTDDCVQWFDCELPDPHHRRYITVCHDICHAAVMMEDQRDVLSRLAAAGIGIGKVQVSNAIIANWEHMAIPRRREALDQLSQFAEDRYLHQTGRRTEAGGFELAQDLPELLANVPAEGDPVRGDQQWAVHFHVPIFLERFGHLSTSRDAVTQALRTLADPSLSIDFTGHLEIETYAWTVLPDAMRQRGLADDIASEIRWLRKTLLEF